MISAARQGGRQCDCDSWGAIALHPWASWDPDPGANCSRAFGGSCLSPGTAGETVPMRQQSSVPRDAWKSLTCQGCPGRATDTVGKRRGLVWSSRTQLSPTDPTTDITSLCLPLLFIPEVPPWACIHHSHSKHCQE